VAKWLRDFLGEKGTLDQLKLSPDVLPPETALAQGADFPVVLAGLLASDPFYQTAGGTDSAFVTSLYQAIVERPPTSAELNTAISSLATDTRQSVALNLLESQEAAVTLVAHWFVDYLGRGPSLAAVKGQPDVTFWAGQLQSAGDSFAILAQILASQEFLGFRPDLYEQPTPDWAPPPGPFAQPVTSQRGTAATFYPGDPVVTTNYFYWYDATSGVNVFYSDGTSALTHHPPTLQGFSYLNTAWHKEQLNDMAAAGIDVALAVSYSTPFSDPNFNDASAIASGLLFTDLGLPPMVAARHQLLQEGVKAPYLGMFYDTTSLSAGHNSKNYQVDLSTLGGKLWLYDGIRNFFSHIPSADWARIDGKPLVFLYHLGFASATDENVYSFVRAMFLRDFGVDLYLVAPDETLAPGIAFSPASQVWVSQLHQADALTVLSNLLAGDAFYEAAGGSDSGLVARLYDKLLNRPADPGGQAAWLASLSNGSRLQVVSQFLYSDESLRNLVAGWYARYLRRLGPLAQLVASPELNPWVAQLASHQDPQTVLAEVLASPEFYGASGGTDAALVENLYQRVLLRTADADGRTYWLGRLGVVSRQQMIDEFLHSDEAYQILAGEWLRYYLGNYWAGRVDAEYDWGGALSPAYRDVAEFGPGYDQSAACDRPPLAVSRAGGSLYGNNWVEFLAMNPRPWLVDIETWDELIEGSDICETNEYGRLYIDLTRQYADQFHTLGSRGP
jgi:hypothetical protein